MKKILSLLVLMAVVLGGVSASAATLYATDGRTIDVADSDIALWESVGWYKEADTIMVYAEDGRTQRIPTVAFDAWHSVGWYSAPVMRVYATDGRSELILKENYEAWKKVGWMDTPMELLYAPYINEVYKIAKADFPSAWTMYIYYDINKDGVRELIVDDGLYEAGRRYYVYTIVDGKVVFLGNIPAGHTSMAHIPNANGVLLMWGHQGYFGASRVELINGQLVNKEVLPDRYYSGDYPESWEIIKGSFDLEFTRVY